MDRAWSARDVSGGVGVHEGDPNDHGSASSLIPFLSPVRIEEDERRKLQTSGQALAGEAESITQLGRKMTKVQSMERLGE